MLVEVRQPVSPNSCIGAIEPCNQLTFNALQNATIQNAQLDFLTYQHNAMTPQEVKERFEEAFAEMSNSKPVNVRLETEYNGSALIVSETVPSAIAKSIAFALIAWRSQFQVTPETMIDFLEQLKEK